MDHFTGKRGINMDGSSDLYFRYKMPAIAVKHEGKGKMKKSVVVNIKEVSESIGRPADYLMTYLGQKLSATAKLEKDLSLSYVTGHHDPGLVQEQILNFIKDAVTCRKCTSPETSCHTEGSKKHKVLSLQCKSCGERSDLDPTDRFVKYMTSHHAEDATYGHAAQNGNTNVETAATAAVAGKAKCPRCHHKTSKSTCSKCGAAIVAQALAEDEPGNNIDQSIDVVFIPDDQPSNEDNGKKEHKKKECRTCHHKTSKPLCSKCGSAMEEPCAMVSPSAAGVDVADDLVDIVRLWMTALEASHSEVSVDDFMAHVKTQGFTQSTPLDHLGAVTQVIACSIGNMVTTATSKLQPIKVAQEVKPFIDMWGVLIKQLFGMACDARAAVDIVISKVHEGVASALPEEARAVNEDCVVVGLLLALRDLSCIADGLLEGCRHLEVPSVAMKKFVDFLADDESDGDQSEEEDVASQECS